MTATGSQTSVAVTARLTVLSLSTTCYGAEQSLLILLTAAAARGRDVLVVAPDGELLAEAARRGLRTAPLPAGAPLALAGVGEGTGRLAAAGLSLAAAVTLARSPLWGRDTVVVSFSQWLNLPVVLAGRLRRGRTALDLHDGPFSRSGAAVQRLAARLADRDVATSRLVLRYVCPPPARTTVVPRPVETPPPRTAADHPGGLRLVVVGRLDPEKRVPVILGAHRRLVDAGADVRLDVVGAPHRASTPGGSLAGWRRDWPLARFHGRLSHAETMDVVAQADLLVSAASGEAFGRTVAEAALLGVPAVVAGGSGPAEFVTHGITGLVLDPLDEQSLTEALRQRTDDRATLRAWGAAARKSVGPLTDPDRVLTAWLDALGAGAVDQAPGPRRRRV